MRLNKLPGVLRYAAVAAALLYAAGAYPRLTGSAPKLAPGGGHPESAPPGATAEVTAVREVRLTANDLVVAPNTQTIFASVPADAPSGNSIAAIEPTTASVGSQVFVGSSPGKMAVSDDGRFIYVVLEGAGAVRRFDVATQSVGPQFTMGNDPSDGPFFSLSLSVAPGNPHTFGVFRLAKAGGFSGNVSVFDDGVMRGATYALPENAASVAFGADASRLYSYAALPRRLARLTASSSGLAVASTSQLSLPATLDAIKFDAGRLYTGSGYVIDAEAGTILGSFPQGGLRSTWPFAVDTRAGRAFYVTRLSQTMTVRAFDINTFQEVGSIDLPAMSTEEPTGLVRWGSNGLALSTTAGRVLIIQSTLVPSPDPVPAFTPTPTPTPIPTPTPFETFVRKVSLPTSDLGYSPATQSLYATLPSSAGANGNSVAPVDPLTGAVGPSVFIGSEPGRMSFTVDGRHIYVALTGATAVRRFDVVTQTAGPQFMLVTNPEQGGDYASDLAPVPGSPGSVAVASRGVYVFDDGVRRPKVGWSGFGGGSVEFSDSPSRLYSTEPTSNGSTFYQHSADETGVTTTQHFRYLLPSSELVYDQGRLYSGARILDPESAALLASFRLNNNSTPFGETCDRSSIAVDASVNRVFFLCSNFGTPTNGTVRIKAFDTQTFVPRGSISITGVTGDTGRLVRWGKNGLAFRTVTNQLFLIQSTLVSPEEPVPTPTPTPSPTPVPTPTPTPSPTPVPTPTPTPTPLPGELRAVTLTAKDLVVDPNTQTIFASVPSAAAASGNSITPIDPVAGSAGQPVPVGSDPGKMAVSDNGQYVYVILNGDRTVRRLDVATRTAGLQFGLGTDPQSGPYGAEDIEVAPGQPGVVAVARTRGGFGHAGVVIYDDGVPRPVTTPWQLRSNRIEFSASPSVLYGQTLESSGYNFRKLGVASCGVSAVNDKSHPYFSSDFQIANGLAYTVAGRVYNPEDLTLLGTFPNAIGLVTPDPRAGRVYVLQGSGGGTFATLRVFDATTFLPIGILRLPGVSGDSTSLVRWGENGLAFNAGTQVFLLRHALIGGTGDSPAVPPPAAPTYTASGSVIAAVGGTAEGVTLTVTGALTTSLTLNAGGSYTLSGIQPCTVPFTITPSKPDYIFNPTSLTVTDLSSAANLQFVAVPKAVGFTRLATNAFEAAGKVQINVGRFGDASQPAAISFKTVPATASDRSDFNTTLGTLNFAPGETSKTISVLLTDDAFAEGPEVFSVVLEDPAGVMLNPFGSTHTVTILDNDPTTATTNPLDGTGFFVRQHYVDFLNREPDASGLAFWTKEIDDCGAAAKCREVKRINVSAAFFLSIEFQQTGYLAYRAHKAAFGDLPGKPAPIARAEMLGNVQVLGDGLTVGADGWEQKLEQNKQAYFARLAASERFTTLYPASVTPEQFVDALNSNAGGALSQAERDSLVADLKATVKTRAQVLRALAEDADLARAESNKAFVLMQFFGYLRRDPDAAPDTDFSGYNFWLGKLNEFQGNFINAEMVKAFLDSIEYKQRFGQ